MIGLGEHGLIVGRTGSGKTKYVLQLVSAFHKKFPKAAIVIINHKNSKDWNALIKPIKRGIVPKFKKGMLLNWAVLPWQDSELNDFLWEVYLKASPTLVVFDEGQNIKDSKFPAAAVLWQQGREMEIGVLTCCQRPVNVSLYAITQATFFTIFNLIGEDDLKKLDGYMEIPLSRYIRPAKVNKDGTETKPVKLKPYHSLLYSVPDGDGVILPPVDLSVKPLEETKPPFPAAKVAGIGLLISVLTFGAL